MLGGAGELVRAAHPERIEVLEEHPLVGARDLEGIEPPLPCALLELFFSGVRPAINVGISVSRVGGNAQVKAMKQIAGSLRLDLAAYRELEAFAQLGTDLDKATQAKLDRGARMVELLKQPQFKPAHVTDQVISIFAGTRGFLDDVDLPNVAAFELAMIEYMHTSGKAVWDEMDQMRSFDKGGELEGQLKDALNAFKSGWKAPA